MSGAPPHGMAGRGDRQRARTGIRKDRAPIDRPRPPDRLPDWWPPTPILLPPPSAERGGGTSAGRPEPRRRGNDDHRRRICGIAAASGQRPPRTALLAAAIRGRLLSLCLLRAADPWCFDVATSGPTGLALTLFRPSACVHLIRPELTARSARLAAAGSTSARPRACPLCGRPPLSADPMVYIALLIVAGHLRGLPAASRRAGLILRAVGAKNHD